MILSCSHVCIHLLLLYILYKILYMIFIVCLSKLCKVKFVIYLTVDEKLLKNIVAETIEVS